MIVPRPLRTLLYPLSVFYEKIVRVRAGLYEKGRLRRKRLNGTVISVGNLTVGGTGKTPSIRPAVPKRSCHGRPSPRCFPPRPTSVRARSRVHAPRPARRSIAARGVGKRGSTSRSQAAGACAPKPWLGQSSCIRRDSRSPTHARRSPRKRTGTRRSESAKGSRLTDVGRLGPNGE